VCAVLLGHGGAGVDRTRPATESNESRAPPKATGKIHLSQAAGAQGWIGAASSFARCRGQGARRSPAPAAGSRRGRRCRRSRRRDSGSTPRGCKRSPARSRARSSRRRGVTTSGTPLLHSPSHRLSPHSSPSRTRVLRWGGRRFRRSHLDHPPARRSWRSIPPCPSWPRRPP